MPDPEGDSAFSNRNTGLAGNYSLPYFSERSGNETFSSIEKFNNFVQDARTTNKRNGCPCS